jgi:hypothetical protein
MTNKHPENREPGRDDRDEKVRELLSILGELYQRVGFQHASPANVRLTGSDFRFMGYRPYSMEAMAPPRPAFVQVPGGPVPMNRAYFPTPAELMTAMRPPGF